MKGQSYNDLYFPNHLPCRMGVIPISKSRIQVYGTLVDEFIVKKDVKKVSEGMGSVYSVSTLFNLDVLSQDDYDLMDLLNLNGKFDWSNDIKFSNIVRHSIDWSGSLPTRLDFLKKLGESKFLKMLPSLKDDYICLKKLTMLLFSGEEVTGEKMKTCMSSDGVHFGCRLCSGCKFTGVVHDGDSIMITEDKGVDEVDGDEITYPHPVVSKDGLRYHKYTIWIKKIQSLSLMNKKCSIPVLSEDLKGYLLDMFPGSYSSMMGDFEGLFYHSSGDIYPHHHVHLASGEMIKVSGIEMRYSTCVVLHNLLVKYTQVVNSLDDKLPITLYSSFRDYKVMRDTIYGDNPKAMNIFYILIALIGMRILPKRFCGKERRFPMIEKTYVWKFVSTIEYKWLMVQPFVLEQLAFPTKWIIRDHPSLYFPRNVVILDFDRVRQKKLSVDRIYLRASEVDRQVLNHYSGMLESLLVKHSFEALLKKSVGYKKSRKGSSHKKSFRTSNFHVSSKKNGNDRRGRGSFRGRARSGRGRQFVAKRILPEMVVPMKKALTISDEF